MKDLKTIRFASLTYLVVYVVLWFANNSAFQHDVLGTRVRKWVHFKRGIFENRRVTPLGL